MLADVTAQVYSFTGDTLSLILDKYGGMFKPARITIELTMYCDIGCSHCKYSTIKRLKNGIKNQNYFLDVADIDCISSFCKTQSIEEIVISGGGEPTYEADSIKRLLKIPGIKKAAIYTAAQWADTRHNAKHFLEGMLELLLGSPLVDLTLRVSVDKYHIARIGDDPLKNLLREYVENFERYRILKVSVRSILGDQDLIAGIFSGLGFSITWSDSSKSKGFAVHDQIVVNIHFMGLVATGRMSSRRIEKETTLDWQALSQHYQALFGPGWPVLYNGGANLGIRPSGEVYLYGGAPNNYGSIRQESLSRCVDNFFKDPINVCLMEFGFGWFTNIFTLFNLNEMEFLLFTNNHSIMVPHLLSDLRNHSAVSLFAFLYLIENSTCHRGLLTEMKKDISSKIGVLPKTKDMVGKSKFYEGDSRFLNKDLGIVTGGNLRVHRKEPK